MSSFLGINPISDEDIRTLEDEQGLIFDEDRKDILKSCDTFDVQACPGSGKTTLIASKLILLSKKINSRYKGVCVLSHTNVAKNEIIEKLKKSKSLDAGKLLHYPHFIGTIQDFVDTFIGLPQVRSKKINVHYINNDRCVESLKAGVSAGTRNYIENSKVDLYKYVIRFQGGRLVFPPPVKAGPHTNTYKELIAARDRVMSNGGFFYKDLYAFSEELLHSNNKISTFLRRRFPLVLIDEMQDTQKYQDELLEKIFIQGDSPSVLQRFGDPDQAIFGGGSDDEPNKSYNSKSSLEMFKGRALENSNRFSESISSKIFGLSYNKISLKSVVENEEEIKFHLKHRNNKRFLHSVLLYDDSTIPNVIEEFSKIVCEQFLQKERLIVKALGANGSEASSFTIRNYFKHYVNHGSVEKNNSEKLIFSIYKVRRSIVGDFIKNLNIVNSSIVKLLKLCGKKDSSNRFYTERSMYDFLIQNQRLSDYKSEVYSIVRQQKVIDPTCWKTFTDKIQTLFDIHVFNSFLDYSEEGSILTSPESILNQYSNNGIIVSIGTIHSAKGETHDATLVLETKNRQFDISELIPWIIDPKKELPTNITLQKFMRQLYVAMSRPTYLLCISLAKNRLNEEQKQKLIEMGWDIKDLTNFPH